MHTGYHYTALHTHRLVNTWNGNTTIWHAWQPWYQARLPVITTVLQLNKNDTANRKTLSHPPPTTPSSTAAKLSYMPATHRITPSAAIHARGVDNLANVNRLLGVYIHDAPHVLAVEEGGGQVVFLHNLLNNTQHSTAVTQYSTAQHSTEGSGSKCSKEGACKTTHTVSTHTRRCVCTGGTRTTHLLAASACRSVQVRHNIPCHLYRVGIIMCVMVTHPRDLAVHVCSTQLLRSDHFPDCRCVGGYIEQEERMKRCKALKQYPRYVLCLSTCAQSPSPSPSPSPAISLWIALSLSAPWFLN